MSRRRLDITNQKFGRLTAIKPSGIMRYGMAEWICNCSCGKTITVLIGNLTCGHTRSCGCLNLDKETTNTRKESRKKYNVDGTCIHQLKRHKRNKNNSSGITGVTLDSRTGKWKVQIIFKKKYYYLGTYERIEDAADIRKLAEEKIFGEFLEWYENEYKPQLEKQIAHIGGRQ